MTDTKYDLVAIGNALIDLLSQTNEDYIAHQDKLHGMKKGSMNLIDNTRALELYGDMNSPTKMPGGSAANTMACFASFGGKGAYIGKVADDELGHSYKSSLSDMGIDYNTAPLKKDEATGRCMILVTPDGERTMNTYLGAATQLTPDDIDETIIKTSQIVYLEGYLYDPPQAMEAFIKAARFAHEGERLVSLTLSDSFCVDRHREAFKDLVSHHVDILFANEDEIKSLYETDNLEEAIEIVSNKCAIVAITRSEKGSIIIKSGHRTNITADPIEKLIDSTGAGDAYAAGFLYGYTQGKDMATCGHYGSIAASHIIQQMGPRPSLNLADLLPKKAA